MEEKENLKNHVVGHLPTVIYIPEFITDAEETQLLDSVYKAPLSKWKSLKNRRLQNWGGIVHEKGLLPQDLPSWLTKITERIHEESGLFPSAINHVLINEYRPDQGIMPHQDGPAYYPVVAILSLGSPAVMDFTPHSSLRSSTSNVKEEDADHVDFNHTQKDDHHHPFSIALMPRSLLIFKDAAYSDYLHGIKDSSVHRLDEVMNTGAAVRNEPPQSGLGEADEVTRCEDMKCIERTSTRVSLTCRLVPKVHKKLFKI